MNLPDLASIPVAGSPTRRRRHRVRRGVTVLAVAGLVTTAGVAYATVAQSGPAGFRTAAVATRDLDSVLTAVATIEPVTQAQVAFPVDGTVSIVDVEVGEKVTSGQWLATLDTSELKQNLHSAKATLAQAQLVLEKALDGEDVTTLTGVAGMSRPVVLDAAVRPTYTLVPAVDADEIAAAQQALLSAQQNADSARNTADTALASAKSVCAAVGTEVSDTDPATTDTSIAACQAALDEVVNAQAAVSDAQAAVSSAASTLNDLLAQYADELENSPPDTTVPDTTVPDTTPPEDTPPENTPPENTPPENTPPENTPPENTPPENTPPETTTPGPSTPSNGSIPGGSQSAPSGNFAGGGETAAVVSPSAEDLVAYQAAVDAAEAGVTVAVQELAQATITSPIAGTVIAVNLAFGSSVTAGSTTASIVIQGAGGYEATTQISVDDIAQVEVGQAASLLPDGSTEAIGGKVVAISAIPDDDATTTSYDVVIALDGGEKRLRNGALGTVSIVTDTATDVLAVPNSAVTTTGARSVVTVVDDGAAEQVAVQVGVVGDTWTEIIDGISAGQQVAVADLSEPLPGSATDESTAAGPFRLGGAGFPAIPGG